MRFILATYIYPLAKQIARKVLRYKFFLAQNLNILGTHSRFVSETLSGSSSSVRAWRTRTTGWRPWSCSTPSPCWRGHWTSSWMMRRTDIHSDYLMLLFTGRFFVIECFSYLSFILWLISFLVLFFLSQYNDILY